MSTYLELVQDFVWAAGISRTGGPSTVASQEGDYKLAVDWIKRADKKIQNERNDWKFMWKQDSFTTSVGVHDYDRSGTVSVQRHNTDSFKCYETATGTSDEEPMVFIPYEDFIEFYENPTHQDNDRPVVFTILPDNTIRFSTPALTGYTVTYDYYQQAVTLDDTDDTDTPQIPERFHDIILYRALMMYGAFESASTEYQDAAANYESYFQDMLWQEVDDPQTRQVVPE